MAFGKLGAMGRGMGHLGALGNASSPKAVAMAALRAAGIIGAAGGLDTLQVAEATGMVDWAGSYTPTAVASIPFTAYKGYGPGNGSSQYVRSGFVPSTNGVNYTLNDASKWIWCLTDAQSATIDAGNGTAPRTRITTRDASNVMSIGINDASASAVSSMLESLGMFGAQRTGATTKKAFKNGVQVGSTFTTASSALPTVEQYYCGSNSGGFSTKQICMYAAGGSLSGKEATFYEIMRTYFNAVRATNLTIDAMGDSFTFNAAYVDLPSAASFYPALTATALNNLGCRVYSRNSGVAGDSTTQMVARLSSLVTPCCPGVALIYGGINDPAAGINAATTTANLVDIVNHASTGYAARGYTRFMILNQHYVNLASGTRDTLALESATYAGIRSRQLDAYTSLAATYGASNVRYVNLYSGMRALIDGVTYTDGGAEWHETTTDVHLNATGEQIVANLVVAEMQAAGWVSGLQ
jgi:lysophospholipase L1-like esterase